MKTIRLYVLLVLIGFSLTSKAQLNPFNEFSVELLGHTLGLGMDYRRTLDIGRNYEFHGLFSAGITSGMVSSYAGFGCRWGMDWFAEVEVLTGYNSLYGLRLKSMNETSIQNGLSWGAHVNWGAVTLGEYTARLTTGYHVYQSNYGQFILGMTVGRFL